MSDTDVNEKASLRFCCDLNQRVCPVFFKFFYSDTFRGRFGIVHKCLHKQNGLEYAAKYVRLRSKRKAETRREVEILQMVRGKTPHIAELQDAFERGRNLIVVTEL